MPVTTKFYEVFAEPTGTQIHNILGGSPSINSGYIKQIFISSINGGGSYMNIQVRYFEDNTDITNLVLSYDRAELPSFAGLNLNAPFDLRCANTSDDLILFLSPEESGNFKIRIDFDLDRR
jgi:hypothetical protein